MVFDWRQRVYGKEKGISMPEEKPRSPQGFQEPQTAQAAEEVMVDALDEGAIVRVSERFARREGLPILRRWVPQPAPERSAHRMSPKETGGMDTFRRPLRADMSGVRGALLDNFHWVLSQRRRRMNLSRKQLAEKVGATEYELKMLENGVLPSNDFVLISALERHCGISLRKEPAASAPPASALRPVKSVLAGGSVPLFGANKRPEEEPARAKALSDAEVMKSEDLIGDAVELDEEPAAREEQ